MRKYLFSLVLSTLFAASAFSQVNVSFSEVNVDQNGEAVVSVSVSNFTDLIAMQTSINWDPSAFSYSAIRNVTTVLEAFSYTAGGDGDAIAVPEGNATVDDGQITIIWFLANGASVPDGTVLFDLVLTAVGSSCDETSIAVSDIPRRRELANTDVDQFLNADAVVSTPAKLKINGTDCENGGGDGNIEMTIDDIQAKPGDQICVPIKVKNFSFVEGAQGNYSWDPTVLSFTGVSNDVLTGNVFNQTNTANGQLGFVWVLDSNPVDIPDGGVLVELCFDVIGSTGDMTTIGFDGDLIDEWVWTVDGVDQEPVLNAGSLSVVDDIVNPVVINVPDVSGDQGSQVCVDFTVDNFVGILGAQFTIEWDATILDYANAGGFNLPGLNESAFNESSDNKLRVQWNPSVNPETLPDGSKFFHICYDIIGDCNSQPTSPLNIVEDGAFKIEFSILDPDPIRTPHSINPGSVKVNSCGTSCTVSSVKDVSCNGGQDGAVSVSVPTSNTACECVWKRSNGQIFQTLPVSNCNLVGAPADTYTLELTCGGNVECTITQEIKEPAALTITETISSVSCGNLGSITVDVNGAMPLTYAWSPGGETTQAITGLQTGSYSVVVTDNNGCSVTGNYEVEEKTDPILITPTVGHAGCFGETNGTISLAVLGGCPAAGGYTYNWEGPTSVSGAEGSNLAPGEYKVTVMDGSNPTLSSIETIMVLGGDAALVINESLGSGSIALNLTGGVSPYNPVWTGPATIADGEENPEGLPEGTYNVTVTDAAGCTTSKAIVVTDSGGPNFGSIDVNSESNNNGFGVSCFDVCDASVSGSIASGAAPFTIQIVSDGIDRTEDVNNVGAFSFDGLCAGSYQFTLTDANGTSVTRDVAITTPTAMSDNARITKVKGDNADGAIRLEIDGGVPEYSYDWSNGGSNSSISNLTIGTYTVVITDENGCQTSGSYSVLPEQIAACYSGLSIITPNNDGYNDEFIITCVESLNNSNLAIYTRYGQQIFSASNYDNDWRGTDQNGELLREGSYLWVLTFESDQNTREVFKGTVTLLRD